MYLQTGKDENFCDKRGNAASTIMRYGDSLKDSAGWSSNCVGCGSVTSVLVGEFRGTGRRVISAVGLRGIRMTIGASAPIPMAPYAPCAPLLCAAFAVRARE